MMYPLLVESYFTDLIIPSKKFGIPKCPLDLVSRKIELPLRYINIVISIHQFKKKFHPHDGFHSKFFVCLGDLHKYQGILTKMAMAVCLKKLKLM